MNLKMVNNFFLTLSYASLIKLHMIKQNGDWVLAHIEQLKNKKVLVVGDVGLDVYIFGEVKRLSPEAPVPILDVAQEDSRLGLAANVAHNIHTLGGQAHLITVVGQDLARNDLQGLLEKNNIRSHDLVEDTSRPTTRKLRLIAGQHHIARVDYEKQNPISESVKNEVFEKISAAIEKADIVILQDYAKGMLDWELCQLLIKKANEFGKKVLVDPYRSTSLTHYKGAYLMTPNRDEAVALARQMNFHISDPLGTEQLGAAQFTAVDQIGRTLMETIDSKNMIVTLGSAGMRLFQDGKVYQLPTFAQSVFDVTGAGDTVISCIALALAADWPLEKACYLANFAAGVVVGKVGCVPCELDELRDFIQRN
jgi:D-glycero-beta-D-manno-heptose-7-phosphate kinase